MSISKSLWLLHVSLLLCPGVLQAHEPSDATARSTFEKHMPADAAPRKSGAAQKSDVGGPDHAHRRAIEAHISESDYRIVLLLRSATVSNIDAVLDSIDAIRRSNEACVERLERCRRADALTDTANASTPLGPFGPDSQM
ncbi:hypothetical protein D9M69_441080 [compost metagenome]